MIVYVVIKGHRSETRVSSSEIEAGRCAEVEKNRQRKEKYPTSNRMSTSLPFLSSGTSRISKHPGHGLCLCAVFAAGISLVAQAHGKVVGAQVFESKAKNDQVAPKYTIMVNQLESKWVSCNLGVVIM